MNVVKKKFAIRLNNIDKIEQLLQETYDLACQQYKAIQDEINKIANSTTLMNLDIDGKEKYGKVINNYISLQQKSITQKFEIAKLMSEIVKYGGDVKHGIDAMKNSMPTTLDIDKLRQLAENANSSTSEAKEYTINKK